MTKSLGRRQKKSKKRRLTRFRLVVYFCFLLAILFCLNLVYQAVRKPSELIGLFESHFHKTPEQTWENYGEIFVAKSTPVIQPEFLAALAQMETGGNPIRRTYWKWRWTTDLDRLYSPASSAVGMFQITEGTFEEARRFCIRDGEVLHNSFGDHGPCWSNEVYSRLIPAHAIEMTAARLHYHTVQTLADYRLRNVSPQSQQALAAVIHLCGLGKGRAFARARFRAGAIGRCGDHDPGVYIRRLRSLSAKFRRLREK